MDIGLLHHQLRNRLITDGISHTVYIDEPLDDSHYRFIFENEGTLFDGILTLEISNDDKIMRYLIKNYTVGDRVYQSGDGISVPIGWIRYAPNVSNHNNRPE